MLTPHGGGQADPSFDPFSLLIADSHLEKLAPIAALPWADIFSINWQGDIACHVPAAEKGNMATMNSMQLDIWDRELVMDPDGDATQGINEDDPDEDDPDDDEDADADEDDEPEEEEEEEEAADNTTMEEEGWSWGNEDDGFESVTLAAPSDTNFVQLRQLAQEPDVSKLDWPSVLPEDRWGDEVEGSLVKGSSTITSIDEAYKSLEPPTMGEAENEVTNRMTTVMRVPAGPWRKHLGIQPTSQDDDDEEEAEITIELSKAWAEIAESVPPMPRKEGDEFKNGIITTISTSTGSSEATYKAESSWRPPQRRQRNNFQVRHGLQLQSLWIIPTAAVS